MTDLLSYVHVFLRCTKAQTLFAELVLNKPSALLNILLFCILQPAKIHYAAQPTFNFRNQKHHHSQSGSGHPRGRSRAGTDVLVHW